MEYVVGCAVAVGLVLLVLYAIAALLDFIIAAVLNFWPAISLGLALLIVVLGAGTWLSREKHWW